MPIYEYTCNDCNSQFEKFVRSITQQEQVQCPECGGTHVKKGWSLFGARLSSSGGAFSAAASDCAPTGT